MIVVYPTPAVTLSALPPNAAQENGGNLAAVATALTSTVVPTNTTNDSLLFVALAILNTLREQSTKLDQISQILLHQFNEVSSGSELQLEDLDLPIESAN